MDTSRRLDAATARALAAAAGVDPRSIVRVFAGESVRGLAGKRARLALVEAGLLSEGTDDSVARLAVQSGAKTITH